MSVKKIIFTNSDTGVKNVFMIPINIRRLQKLSIIKDYTTLPKIHPNLLEPVNKQDYNIISNKLNVKLNNCRRKIKFDEQTVCYYFAYQPDIIYSYVIRNNNGEVTDFISAYVSKYTIPGEKNIILNANLSFYFCETVSITDLLKLFSYKLYQNRIDQLCYYQPITHDIPVVKIHKHVNKHILDISMDDKGEYFIDSKKYPDTDDLVMYPLGH